MSVGALVHQVDEVLGRALYAQSPATGGKTAKDSGSGLARDLVRSGYISTPRHR
jgi:hypothetical protein